MNILITGQNGFVGTHLTNHLKYIEESFSLIEFNRSYFHDEVKLDLVVKKADVIIHLAAVNRSKKVSEIFDVNYNIAKNLNESIRRVKFSGKLIFTSSIQENQNNNYGKAKKMAREIFEKSSKEIKFKFSALLIPNVFGPFCKPNYNSFISTFCENISKQRPLKIKEDKIIPLIYIDKLIKEIIYQINSNLSEQILLKFDKQISVLEVQNKLEYFNDMYVLKNTIPKLESDFDLNLFNTFRSFFYEETMFFPRIYNPFTDERGVFSEILRSEGKGQFSFSLTKPNQTRGNHFHTRKIERFSVIKGESLIQLRKIGTDSVTEFKLNGKNLSYIDMPIWYTHNIKNIGSEDLITLFWVNEPYDTNDPDTYQEKV